MSQGLSRCDIPSPPCRRCSRPLPPLPCRASGDAWAWVQPPGPQLSCQCKKRSRRSLRHRRHSFSPSRFSHGEVQSTDPKEKDSYCEEELGMGIGEESKKRTLTATICSPPLSPSPVLLLAKKQKRRVEGRRPTSSPATRGRAHVAEAPLLVGLGSIRQVAAWYERSWTERGSHDDNAHRSHGGWRRWGWGWLG